MKVTYRLLNVDNDNDNDTNNNNRLFGFCKAAKVVGKVARIILPAKKFGFKKNWQSNVPCPVLVYRVEAFHSV